MARRRFGRVLRLEVSPLLVGSARQGYEAERERSWLRRYPAAHFETGQMMPFGAGGDPDTHGWAFKAKWIKKDRERNQNGVY